jgi:drug/metabolite transporter (DMT)-like permease
MTLAGARSFLAALVLLAVRLFLPPGNSSRHKAELCRLLLKDAPILALCGLCYTATMILFITANRLTASANVIMLQYAAPVWAALLGWLILREQPRWEHWVAMALVGLGMFLVFSGGFSKVSLVGDIASLVSGITFAGNSVVLRARKTNNPADIMFYAHILCVAICLPFFFLHPPSLTTKNIICISYMGIFQLGVATALFAYGIRVIPAVQAMLTATVEPVLNPVWVLLAIGEKPAFSVIAGGGIIIAAVVFSSTLSALRRRN